MEKVKTNEVKINKGIRRLSMHVRQFLGNRSGVSAIEYALIVVAVITLATGGIAVLTGGFQKMFDQTEQQLKQAVNKAKNQADID